MSKRPGDLIYREDQDMLKELDYETFYRFITLLWEFSVALDETGEIIDQDLPFDGMVKSLYKAMKNKIIHDAERYEKTVKENTIKGLMSAIKREAQADGRKVSSQQARAQAEHLYCTEHRQPRPTAVNTGQLTERSTAQLSSTVTPSINSSSTTTALVRPTAEEIIDFCKSKNLQCDYHLAESFISIMDEQKWRHSGIPLDDWKAACYTYIVQVKRNG